MTRTSPKSGVYIWVYCSFDANCLSFLALFLGLGFKVSLGSRTLGGAHGNTGDAVSPLGLVAGDATDASGEYAARFLEPGARLPRNPRWLSGLRCYMARIQKKSGSAALTSIQASFHSSLSVSLACFFVRHMWGRWGR